jgi:hypothetical protein
MGFIADLTGKTARKAAEENKRGLAALKTEGMGYLDAGKTGALDSLDAAIGTYAPLAAKYGAGSDLYLDSLGVNGADGNARAVNAFQAGPGYDFAVNQSLDALDRRAASRGMLASGNNTIDTLNTVTGLANQSYGDWQNRLAGLISPEMAATSGMASGEAAKAPIYTTDALNRVNLASNITNGINSQNTQAANAANAGAMGLAKLGVGLATAAMGMPGGTSMLGGLGGIGYGTSPSGWLGNTGMPGWIQG